MNQDGLPIARIDADATIITISQRHNAPGLQIAITPRDKADEDAPAVAIAQVSRKRSWLRPHHEDR